MESAVVNGPVRPNSEQNLREAQAVADAIIKQQIKQDEEIAKQIGVKTKQVLNEAAQDFLGILGSGFDVYDVLQDTNQNSGGWGSYPYTIPPYYRNNQNRGELLPVYLDENALKFIRDRSRKICAENPFAICALENRINYSVGEKGLKIVVTKNSDDCPSPLVKRAQKVIDLWQERNEMPEMEADLVRQGDTDGEHYIRDFPQNSGMLLHRAVEPEHIIRPPGGDYGPHYSFGIQTSPTDIHKVEGYWVIENPIKNNIPRFVSADEMSQFKYTTPRSAKRGLPLFYSCEVLLRYAMDLLRGVVTTANIRARYAVIKKATNGLVRDAAQKLSDSLKTCSVTDPGNGQSWNTEKVPFGSIVSTGSNQEFEFPSSNFDTNTYEVALQMVLRAVAARCNMPEWMLTSDASNANYSSSFIAEAPSIKSFGKLQEYICRRVGINRMPGRESLAWRQIKHAIACGVLPPEALHLLSLTCEGPSLVVRDKASEAQVNAQLMQAKIKSPQEIQQEMGIDSEKTFKQWQEWNKKILELNQTDPDRIQQQQDQQMQMQMQQDQALQQQQVPAEGEVPPTGAEQPPMPEQQESIREAEEEVKNDEDCQKLKLVIKILAKHPEMLDYLDRVIEKLKSSNLKHSDSLSESSIHQNFTGVKRDSLGRIYHFVNGERVSYNTPKEKSSTSIPLSPVGQNTASAGKKSKQPIGPLLSSGKFNKYSSKKWAEGVEKDLHSLKDLESKAKAGPEPSKKAKAGVWKRIVTIGGLLDGASAKDLGVAVGATAVTVVGVNKISKNLKKIVRTITGNGGEKSKKKLTLAKRIKLRQYQKDYHRTYRKRMKFLQIRRNLASRMGTDIHSPEVSKMVEGFDQDIKYHSGGTMKGKFKRGITRVFATGLAMFKTAEPIIAGVNTIASYIAKAEGYDPAIVDTVSAVVGVADMLGKGLDLMLGKKLRDGLGDEGLEVLSYDSPSPNSLTMLAINGGLDFYQLSKVARRYVKPTDIPPQSSDSTHTHTTTVYTAPAKSDTEKVAKIRKQPRSGILPFQKQQELLAAVHESNNEFETKKFSTIDKVKILLHKFTKYGLWYQALMTCALDKYNGDFEKALSTADKIYKKHPK